jgi:hypothetical protein
MRRRPLLLTAALLMGTGRRALALDAPTGPVLLTVSGRIEHANRGGATAFDMAMLARLPQAAITTHTPWFSQARKFSGPLLREVIAAAGGQGRQLRALALNDYRVDIPVDDAQRYDVVLATALDDKPMSVREKGPLFIIYPFDDHAELRNALYYSRCAWQLKAIEIV